MFKKMNLFGKTGIKLLRFLLDNPMKDFYEREISNKSGVSIGATNKMLKTFAELSIIKREKRGKMYFYRVSMESPIARQFKILFNVLEINDFLERIRPLTMKIILFGSCAEGTDTEESDMDIFILTKDKKAVLAAMRQATRPERRISPIIIETLQLPAFKKENAPLYEKIKSGIVLWDKNGLQI